MSNAFLVGTRKGLLIYRKANGRWRPEPLQFPGVKVPMVLSDRRDGKLYASVDHGHFGAKMHRSENGVDWEELPPPAYPERPADVEPTLCPMRKKEIPWSLELIWSLESGGRDEPGVLWCGTIPGGLFKSSTSGESWDLVRSLWDRPERAKWFGGGYDYPGIHSICVDPLDARRLTIGVSCGGVWQSQDGGVSWELVGNGMAADYMPPEMGNDPGIQDVHRLVSCPAAPDVFWNQHHSTIYRSTDGAQNFTELVNAIPSRFGFVVAAHPTDPLTAWFVPATKDEMRIPVDGKVVVSRTTDGGASFEAFGAGLPSENATHLIYRHCLEVDDSGRTLVMGSTTGSLWISEDGGESWERLTAELAPIYCVRWM
jgi:hypothetical protein